MYRMQQMTPVISETHMRDTEIEGMFAGFGLSRHTDGRLPEISRRQRRIKRQRRLN